MKSVKYNLHNDFKGFDLFVISNLKLTPLKLKFVNLIGTLNAAFTKPDKALTVTRTRIKGYHSGQVDLTIYEPKDKKGELPCVIFLHGGAFVLGDMGYMHKIAGNYALGADCKVVFVHHRLAPEYTYPTALEDSYRTLLFIYKNAERLNIDKHRIAVAGDSSGGAIAAALTHLSRDRKGPPICFQLLIYPVTDYKLESGSMKSFYDSPFWNSNLNRQMWQYYLGGTMPESIGYASPLYMENFTQLPDAYIEVEEFDCLRDEGIAYADKLKEHGINVELNYGSQLFHLFDMMQSKPIVKKMMKLRTDALRKGLYKQEEE